jgi:NAD+ kinase
MEEQTETKNNKNETTDTTSNEQGSRAELCIPYDQFRLRKTLVCRGGGDAYFPMESLALEGVSASPYRLLWRSPPRNVLLIGKDQTDEVNLAFSQLTKLLTETKKMNVFVHNKNLKHLPQYDPADNSVEIDLVICLGGDGTFLYAASLFPRRVPPVLSFNFGSLGFLIPFTYEEDAENLLEEVLGGTGFVTMRMRLSCTVKRADSSAPQKKIRVLNEISVERGVSPFLTNLDCYCDDALITKVQGDGIIIATATGSTAYSLAAGGPLVHPAIPAILFTPICPHSLSFRPVALPETSILEIKVPTDARGGAMVVFDGRESVQLNLGDSIVVTVSRWPVPAVSRGKTTSAWFQQLAQKLNWNVRVPQKGPGGKSKI